MRIAAVSVAVLAVAAYPAAAGAESCAYNPATKVVTASITPGSEATLKVAANGQLLFGLAPVACGAATTTNTDTIQVSGTAGSTERLTLDQSDGFLGPGAAAESNAPEIEVATTLGDAADEVVVIGTQGADQIAMGANGLSLNSDGDLDVTFAPLPASVEIQGLGGTNQLTGRGGWGAGLAYAGRVVLTGGDLADELNGGNGNDVLTGGGGNDVLNGSGGSDQMTGGPGNDKLSGGEGNDHMVGGSGADELVGGFGNDLLVAFDGEADTALNGGPDADTVYYDPGLDPTPSAAEAVFGGPPTESCTYDPVAKTVTARLEPGTQAAVKVAATGEILFGVVPVPCGAATTVNTDSISVRGAAGLAEKLTLDQTDGFLGPGATAETNMPEIEMTVNLGDAADPFVVLGTDGDDVMAAGLDGFSLNADGDVDVTFSPLPTRMEIHGLGGTSFLTGRGGFGAGLAYPGDLLIVGGELADELNGGIGNDTIIGAGGNDSANGSSGNDQIFGGPGNDTLVGSDGNDFVSGGPGADDLLGSNGDDTIDANDDEADVQIHGGPGVDTAFYDAGIDPSLIAVENPVADPGQEPPPPPPPPAPGTCAFDAQSKTVTAAMPASGAATLAVVSGEIHFGATPVACGAATTASADTVRVLGAAGTAEQLTIDQSGGALAPGASAETNTPEIEVSVELGDVADEVVVVGTPQPDVLAVGLNGVALNSDGDVDVTFAPLPGRVTLRGLGGPNVLGGRGSYGAGLAYQGNLVLVAGDDGDELIGGEGADVLQGGAGADSLFAYGGADELYGAGGNDWLNGGDGNDLLVGGSGSDTFLGGFDADVLRADDGEADAQVNGGPGTDTAYYDGALDPAPSAVEILFPV